ncbi:MAG: hypothetical protein HC828_21980 [Blastochloris sp.]|nr:hypothetical protein [Blastochloris sp.]
MLAGFVALLRDRDRRFTVLLIVAWVLAGAAAISTLDTAFWHFKRYQMPLFALVFPLAGWGAGMLIGWRSRSAALVALALAALLTLPGALRFLDSFVVNVGYVRQQPYAMADWLLRNAPPNVLVAVHDVGMMRFRGGRTTLDIVGLTTPDAAAYWRAGPGAVGEFIDGCAPT